MMINININNDLARIVSNSSNNNNNNSFSCNQIGTLDKLRGEQEDEIHLNNPKRNAKRVSDESKKKETRTV